MFFSEMVCFCMAWNRKIVWAKKRLSVGKRTENRYNHNKKRGGEFEKTEECQQSLDSAGLGSVCHADSAHGVHHRL